MELERDELERVSREAKEALDSFLLTADLEDVVRVRDAIRRAQRRLRSADSNQAKLDPWFDKVAAVISEHPHWFYNMGLLLTICGARESERDHLARIRLGRIMRELEFARRERRGRIYYVKRSKPGR